jgi:hypothetical protein
VEYRILRVESHSVYTNQTQTCRNHTFECHIHTHTCQKYTNV